MSIRCHNLCIESSTHGSERRSSEMPKLAYVQPITFGFEEFTENLRCQDDFSEAIEVADYLRACGSVVLVVRTAGELEKRQVQTEI